MHPYFLPKQWERGGTFYARLGIRRFRPFVAGGRFWQKLRIGPRAPGWRRSTVARYVRESVVAEVAHTTSFVLLAFISILFIVHGDWVPAAVVLAGNVVINVAPVAVLRYNRARILSRGAGPNNSFKPNPHQGRA